MNIELRHIAAPDMDVPLERLVIPVEEYAARSRDLYASVGLDWVAIYGDREHNANLLFLSGFDPRFEEALLLLGPKEQRILLVGNEGVTHAVEALLPVQVVLYQQFSLMGQSRETSLPLSDLLREIGIHQDARIGVIGWKYLAAGDVAHPDTPAYVPAFLLQVLEHISGTPTTDVTSALMDPVRVCAIATPRPRLPSLNGVPPGRLPRSCESYVGQEQGYLSWKLSRQWSMQANLSRVM